MSNSTSADAAKLFQKRRRACIACSNCRRRKIKKGLTCEYIAVPDDDSLTAESFQAAPAHSGRDASPGPEQWLQHIRPPSAGLSAFMPDARGSRKSHPGHGRGHAPASAGAGPSSLYRPPNWPTDASPVASIAQPRHGSRAQASGAGPYLSSGMPGFQVAAPQYSGQASYGGAMGPNYPAMSPNYPPTNYGQPAYRGQPGGSAYAYTAMYGLAVATIPGASLVGRSGGVFFFVRRNLYGFRKSLGSDQAAVHCLVIRASFASKTNEGACIKIHKSEGMFVASCARQNRVIPWGKNGDVFIFN
ncbi:hypothetical protein GGX14DRAFT_392764 [Mycena pura]|uniref:Uncharacterized protein n=1 Tax=Mycena pura TaxID=153505 RepID=A0AAD6VKA5_9AGAR|nr:hypothetical protein GGX14DRAFT_392764 [Mycena pura]